MHKCNTSDPTFAQIRQILRGICISKAYYLQYCQICESDICYEILLIFTNLIWYDISPKNWKFFKILQIFAKYQWMIGFVVDQKYLKIIGNFAKKSQYYGIFSIVISRKKLEKLRYCFFHRLGYGGDNRVHPMKWFPFRDIARINEIFEITYWQMPKNLQSTLEEKKLKITGK